MIVLEKSFAIKVVSIDLRKSLSLSVCHLIKGQFFTSKSKFVSQYLLVDVES